MGNKISYGLKNIYYAKVTNTGGVISYGTPVAIPGAKEISLEPTGDPTIVWADDVQYVVIPANGGYEDTVTVLDVPQSFYTDILGMSVDANYVLVESEDDVLSQFALIGETVEYDSADGPTHKRFVFYNCTAEKAPTASSTKEDTIEPTEYEINITAVAALDTGYVKASVTDDPDSLTEFNGWLSSVYVPNFSGAKLTALTIGSATLSPTFDGDVFHYTAATSTSTGTISATGETGASVTATLNGAAFTLGNSATWESGDNELVVYCANTGKATSEYYVTITYTP